MSAYRISKNVPVPERCPKFPWRKMEIGDSFFVPEKSAGIYGSRVSISAANFKRRCAKPFNTTIRRVKGGYRAWRIAP